MSIMPKPAAEEYTELKQRNDELLGTDLDSKYHNPEFHVKYKGVFIPWPWYLSLDEVQTFEGRPGDICLVSFPKSGNNLLCAVVLMIMNDADPACLHSGQPLHEAVPFLEQVRPMEIESPIGRAIFKIKAAPSPRIYATHLSANGLPESILRNAKIVHLVRNPKDVMISMQHWLRALRVGYHGDLSFLIDQFLDPTGYVYYGPYFDHLASYWALKGQPNVHFCTFEQLIKDFSSAVSSLANYFGKELSNEQVNAIIRECSFEQMKYNPMTNRQEQQTIHNAIDHSISPHMRQGKIGGWKNVLDVKSNRQIDDWVTKNLKRPELSGVLFEFE